ncbi:DUF58 domain-containing protein [uncultured Marinobacter sp.]|uniref:DUF58 domain-containing protein n=1 Tax=uncultured Marinobacter sp. TaxID=187379 RepID=UPI0030DBD594
MKKTLQRRWQYWINRRIPRSDRCRFDRHSIFILPTGAGVLFGVLLLVMLITGINYQNSLIYLLTFMLGAVFVAAMHQTHNNLSGLELTLLRPGEGFAGDDLPFSLRIAADHEAQGIQLSYPDQSPLTLTLSRAEMADGVLSIPVRQRGLFTPDRIRIETRFPFGLLKAWSWLRPETPAVVYPRPIRPVHAMEAVADGEELEATRISPGQDQVELRPWREGDLSARIDWKRFARNGDMSVADWQGEQGSPQWLDYDAFPGVDRELRLSYLASLVLARETAAQPYGLRLPGLRLEPDLGASHRARCLRALGLFGFERQTGSAVTAAREAVQ